MRVEVGVNGSKITSTGLERAGLFIIEADLPDAPEYTIEVTASPSWEAPPDDRIFTVSLSMIRLVPAE